MDTSFTQELSWKEFTRYDRYELYMRNIVPNLDKEKHPERYIFVLDARSEYGFNRNWVVISTFNPRKPLFTELDKVAHFSIVYILDRWDKYRVVAGRQGLTSKWEWT